MSVAIVADTSTGRKPGIPAGSIESVMASVTTALANGDDLIASVLTAVSKCDAKMESVKRVLREELQRAGPKAGWLAEYVAQFAASSECQCVEARFGAIDRGIADFVFRRSTYPPSFETSWRRIMGSYITSEHPDVLARDLWDVILQRKDIEGMLYSQKRYVRVRYTYHSKEIIWTKSTEPFIVGA